jgi:hypothetical protein
MFSGLVSAFQVAELAVDEDAAGSGDTERLPLVILHEVLESAFALPAA